jgi:hypothetical protein
MRAALTILKLRESHHRSSTNVRPDRVRGRSSQPAGDDSSRLHINTLQTVRAQPYPRRYWREAPSVG